MLYHSNHICNFLIVLFQAGFTFLNNKHNLIIKNHCKFLFKIKALWGWALIKLLVFRSSMTTRTHSHQNMYV